jgi:hypothetical protein
MAEASPWLDNSTYFGLVVGAGVTRRVGEVAPEVRWIERRSVYGSEHEVDAEWLRWPPTWKVLPLESLPLTTRSSRRTIRLPDVTVIEGVNATT